MNVWAVRGGADGEYEDYALSEGAALTDFDLRRSVTDFADRTALRDFLNAEEDSAYRGRLRSAANAASQLWRFANEIQVGDMILLPRKKTREVAVGTVTGEYRLVADAPFEACHARDVAWRAVDVPRDAFDAGILTAIRSMLTVFQVKRDGAAARIGNAVTAYETGELYASQDEDDDAQDAPPAAPPTETAPAAEGEIAVKSPMPGILVSLAANEGDRVEEGAPLLVLEAMKMQNAIPAPAGGVIKSLPVPIGTQVVREQTLAVIEAD